MTERFAGETPAAALDTFIEEHCRSTESESKKYAYQDRSIEPVEDDDAPAYTFSFTRREGTTRVVYREYEGSIYATSVGEYVIEHWDTTVRDDSRSPKPPGKTPGRLRGRRPRDRWR